MKKKYFKRVMASGLMLAVITSCSKQEKTVLEGANAGSKSESSETSATGGTLIFKSGFEAGTKDGGVNDNPVRILPWAFDAKGTDIVGSSGNGAGVESSDWVFHLEQKFAKPNTAQDEFKAFRLNYQTGTTSDRYAEIVNNPSTSGNSSAKAMKFQLINAKEDNGSCGLKSRVQGELNSYPFGGTVNASGVRQYYQKLKMFFPDNFNNLVGTSFPDGSKCEWLAVFEYHNRTPIVAGASNPLKDFRIGVNIVQNAAKTGLYFQPNGDDGPDNSWKNTWKINTFTTGTAANSAATDPAPVTGTVAAFPIPTGKWIDTEIFLQEGTSTSNGRFYMAAKLATSTTWIKICDIKVRTVDKTNNAPTGFTNFGPLKFYTNDNVLHNRMGRNMAIFYDDLEIWKNRIP